jgi:hypothetical protein
VEAEGAITSYAMPFSVTRRERLILTIIALLVVTGLLGLWIL